MPDLIIHIGLSKCASTSIQRFLADAPGYLGRLSSDKAGNELTTELLRTSPVNRLSPLVARRKALTSWRKAVEGHMEARQIADRNVIISREEFSKLIDDNTSLVNFLETLNEHVWTYGSVKVILVLRRQADKIASEYAQRSSGLFNANQKDFERYASARMKSRTLDYDNLISRLRQKLGEENLLPLLVEEAGDPRFWKEIRSFCQISEDQLPINQLNATKSNVKSQGDMKWMLPPPPCQDVDAKGFANKVLTWTWPTNRFPRFRQASFGILKRGYISVCRSIRIFERKREPMIRLHPELAAAIEKRYAESNKALGSMIKKDPSRLEYHVQGASKDRSRSQ